MEMARKLLGFLAEANGDPRLKIEVDRREERKELRRDASSSPEALRRRIEALQAPAQAFGGAAKR